MEIRVEQGRAGEYPCDLLLFAFESPDGIEGPVQEIDSKWAGAIGRFMKAGDFRGDLYECRLFHTHGHLPASRIVLTGLGKKADFNLERWRGASSKAGRFLRDMGIPRFAFPMIKIPGLTQEAMAESFVTGFLLGTYQFNVYKTAEREKVNEIQEAILLGETPQDVNAIREGLRIGKIISTAVCTTRDLANGPSNEITPTVLSERAREVAKAHAMAVEIFELSQAQTMGMGAFAAVAKGSQEPAKFIVLEYNPGKDLDTIALVGKGITFDSGGLSIKPAESMEKMKDDMSGAAAVVAILKAAAELGIPLHLVAIIPATENLPSGKAYKPGDILKTLSGQTVEVISTDAEGRLILSDALTYCLRYKPKAIIDLATLTGAIVIALGEYVIGLFGNDEPLLRRVEEASVKTGEKVWQLPLWEEYFENLKSDVADFRNAGTRSAGAINGAVFLSRFVDKVPWVHLDIAGTAWVDKEKPYTPRGATGSGVRLVLQMLRDWK